MRLYFLAFLLSAFCIGESCAYDSSYESFFCDETISHPERLSIKRYLLPREHPAKEELDKLFSKTRAVFDEESFLQAGFIPLISINKDKIVVARHPLLKGYIIKTYLDKYPVNKRHDPDWLWLARRCTLAKKIASVIEKRHLKNFTVPKKWLYPIAKTEDYKNQHRINALLIEEEMPILSHAENKAAWENISYDALDELADIILYAGGKSYRPDNVWITANSKFAIIDTEYPHLMPRPLETLAYLTEEKARYWEFVIVSRILTMKNKF